MMQFAGIIGRQVFVVICWTKHAVTVVGVADDEDYANKLRQKFIDEAPDSKWGKASGERGNNTWVEPHFIQGVI